MPDRPLIVWMIVYAAVVIVAGTVGTWTHLGGLLELAAAPTGWTLANRAEKALRG